MLGQHHQHFIKLRPLRLVHRHRPSGRHEWQLRGRYRTRTATLGRKVNHDAVALAPYDAKIPVEDPRGIVVRRHQYRTAMIPPLVHWMPSARQPSLDGGVDPFNTEPPFTLRREHAESL